MVKMQKRISYGLEVLQYYTTKEWNFKNDNYLALQTAVSKEDNNTFYTDGHLCKPPCPKRTTTPSTLTVIFHPGEVQPLGDDPDELLGDLYAEGEHESQPDRDGTADGEE
ncbi:Fatty acyl reductase [Operophtera brumata]|uniref:Fatty acyl reductase n=1 Tax=Operophtera brumata TaxID=104452 RepID=A0A0L7LJB2_OPEBR|nr:Fatty acyl reductase [Operophtera brumata]